MSDEPYAELGRAREPLLGVVVQYSSRGAAWIRLSGELDLTGAEQLSRCVDGAFARARLVVVDLRQLTFADSVGVRSLAEAHMRARARERRLVFIRGPRQIDRLMEISGLSGFFEITDLRAIQLTPAVGATSTAA